MLCFARALALCPLLPALVSLAPGHAADKGAREETLRYSINWPSGLSLGEAILSRQNLDSGGLEMHFRIDAGIPGFQVVDRFTARSTASFCSQEFEKHIEHGKRKSAERSIFDPATNTVRRQTIGGGTSELPAEPCARDALTFLHFVRQELSQGRLPPETRVFFGAPYTVRFAYAATQIVTVGEQRLEADVLNVIVKGKVADHTFQMYFAREPARTPVLVKLPLSMGLFSMELVR